MVEREKGLGKECGLFFFPQLFCVVVEMWR
jgi:hypothetical protein